jgi:hypothetical protein
VDDLDDLLAGVELADDLGPEAALLDGRRELLDDLEVDVGLEQRETDLAHGLVDVVLGQRAVGADVGERLLELSERASNTGSQSRAAWRRMPREPACVGHTDSADCHTDGLWRTPWSGAAGARTKSSHPDGAPTPPPPPPPPPVRCSTS